MENTERQEFSEEEEYATAYFYFIESLKILAEDAESQCKAMGYFNVAWELKDDVSRGAEAVLSLRGGHLTDEQREAILEVLTELASVPDVVLNVANVMSEHIRAMNHSFWDIIRIHAKNLVLLLESETKRVNIILGNENT